MRHKPPHPDTRPDWRDPNMKCWFNRQEYVSSKRASELHRISLHISIDPWWDEDPTYDLKKNPYKLNDPRA